MGVTRAEMKRSEAASARSLHPTSATDFSARALAASRSVLKHLVMLRYPTARRLVKARACNVLSCKTGNY